MAVYDLHSHSSYSDGDFDPETLVQEAKNIGLAGLALTDHNGIGGLDRARNKAQELGLKFIGGIEISARYGPADVHVLGYGVEFNRTILEQGLVETRRGYEERVAEMVRRCRRGGFDKVNWEAIVDKRRKMPGSVMISFDVTQELVEKQGLSMAQAHKMTVVGGECYVPYGNWAMDPGEVVKLIQQAGGVAVLAHPGIVAHEYGKEVSEGLLRLVLAAGVDGLEIYHPFHDQLVVDELADWAVKNGLLMTGGSDWHGESRFPKSRELFGKIGVDERVFEEIQVRCRHV